jgi:HlyD family secretion protein
MNINKFKEITKKPLFWIGAVVLIIVLIIVFSGNKSLGKYDYSEAKRGDIAQKVSVTGSVRSIEGVDLGFEKSGRVTRTAVAVGDEVYRGEPLIFLEVNDLYAQLDEAKAGLKVEEARLNELKRGPTSYEIKVKESEVEETRQNLLNEYDNVLNTVRDAYNQAYYLLRDKTPEIFEGSKNDYNYDLTFTSCYSEKARKAENSKLEMEFLIEDWWEEIKDLENVLGEEGLEKYLTSARENILIFGDFLDYTSEALESACISNDTISSYKSSVNTARTSLSTALSNVESLKQSIAYKKATLDKKEKELDQLLAGSSKEELAVQEATVERVAAQVDNILAQIEKNILRAPFRGVITKVNAEIGEIVDAYEEVVSVVSSSGFKIEVNIPEVDVAKVEVGDSAEVTLDAYGDDVIFKAEVITIDLTETAIEGVSTYGATLEFKESDKRIKSGMTANVDIITATRENVVYIPQRAVIKEDGKSFVRVLKGEEIDRREVVTGTDDSMGNVEIVEGVEEGEKVVVFINEN